MSIVFLWFKSCWPSKLIPEFNGAFGIFWEQLLADIFGLECRPLPKQHLFSHCYVRRTHFKVLFVSAEIRIWDGWVRGSTLPLCCAVDPRGSNIKLPSPWFFSKTGLVSLSSKIQRVDLPLERNFICFWDPRMFQLKNGSNETRGRFLKASRVGSLLKHVIRIILGMMRSISTGEVFI